MTPTDRKRRNAWKSLPHVPAATSPLAWKSTGTPYGIVPCGVGDMSTIGNTERGIGNSSACIIVNIGAGAARRGRPSPASRPRACLGRCHERMPRMSYHIQPDRAQPQTAVLHAALPRATQESPIVSATPHGKHTPALRGYCVPAGSGETHMIPQTKEEWRVVLELIKMIRLATADERAEMLRHPHRPACVDRKKGVGGVSSLPIDSTTAHSP